MVFGNIDILQIKCLGCGYSWNPRIEKPKECPNCKRRLDKQNVEVNR